MNGPTQRTVWGFWVGLSLAVATGFLSGLAEYGLRPWHRAEVAQPLLGPIIALDDLTQMPGKAVAAVVRAERILPAWAAWLLRTLSTMVLYFLLVLGLARIPARPVSIPVPVASRRTFLRRSGLGASMALLGYGLGVEPRWFTITRQTLSIRDLPQALDGLRVVQLTDLHHGPWLWRSHLAEVVDAANALEPDLVLLTGDYIYRSSAYIEPVIREMLRLRPRIATLGVMGNHDRWDGGEKLGRAFSQFGVLLIDNTRRILTPERQLVPEAAEGLALCGVGDLWTDVPDYRVLDGLPETMPRLLLSHNPDVAEEPGLRTGTRRVDLMVCGHTHGGQVWLPGLGTPFVPSRYGQKYSHGLVLGPTCPVFICRGIGMSLFPLRLGVRPEIAVLELRRP